MTTDITELAQSLKAAAESVIKHYDSEWFEAGHQICTVHKSKINLISLANPANVLALVEALEKAQETEKTLESRNRRLDGIITAAEKRIAELESRTVKLPDLRQIVSGDRYVWSDGVYNYSQDVKVVLAAADIKVEAE
ncbi:hypothetical protein N7615_25815 [Klebsiella grimontii]|uniref:hypothetical protein n=1 Tax=Klebsiella grimontii TaxID=2058152 RepID=UPI0012B94AAA|nr:hypothetical protein [Klebsiella grimontii]MDG9900748.1 hypothetical protein [Klebsiella grimontii]